MDYFPYDVLRAERLTRGNVAILDRPEFNNRRDDGIEEESLARKQIRLLQSIAVASKTAAPTKLNTYTCSVCHTYTTQRMELIVMHYRAHKKGKSWTGIW